MITRATRFTRANRLTQSADFKQAFKTRRRSSDGVFLVLANRNRLPVARLGLAISRKAIPAATGRNLVKRQVREHFRLNRETMTGWDIVVVMNRPAKNLGKKQIRQSLINHWQRLAQCV